MAGVQAVSSNDRAEAKRREGGVRRCGANLNPLRRGAQVLFMAIFMTRCRLACRAGRRNRPMAEKSQRWPENRAKPRGFSFMLLQPQALLSWLPWRPVHGI